MLAHRIMQVAVVVLVVVGSLVLEAVKLDVRAAVEEAAAVLVAD